MHVFMYKRVLRLFCSVNRKLRSLPPLCRMRQCSGCTLGGLDLLTDRLLEKRCNTLANKVITSRV